MVPGIVACVADVEFVNPVPIEDAEGWVRQLMTSLLHNPHTDDFPRRVERWTARWVPERTWAIRDHGRIVGTLATDARTMTIPTRNGATADIAVDALTGVTVAATHRRRGFLTKMLSESLQAAKDRGDAMSVLLAAEWMIYGRFGYAPAMQHSNYTYYPRRYAAAIPPAMTGAVRQVEPAELLAHAPAIFERHRHERGGQINRTQSWWELTVGLDSAPIGGTRNWYLHEGPDGPDGLLTWKVSRDFELDGRLGAIEVDHLIAASDVAYRNLWSYLGGIDVIEEVTMWNRPTDEPARFMTGNGRALTQTYCGDSIWMCLLDVPAALSARGYATEGRLVLDLADDSIGGYARGRYVLDASADGVTCSATTDSPDLTLPAYVLAACYFGAHTVRTFAAAGGIDEHTPGALQLLDTMLSTSLQPWCQTPF